MGEKKSQRNKKQSKIEKSTYEKRIPLPKLEF